MSAIGDYKNRVHRSGSIRDSQINNFQYALNTSFELSPAYTVVSFNSATPSVGVWIVSAPGSNLNRKKIIMKPGDSVNVGDLVTLDSGKWMCIQAEKNNPLNESGIIVLCNGILTILYDTITEIIGYDDLGRPIKDETQIYKNYDCFVQSKTRLQVEEDRSINIPDGRIFVSIQYDPNLKIDNKKEFDLYGMVWRVVEMDYTNVIGNVGVLSFMAERDIDNEDA